MEEIGFFMHVIIQILVISPRHAHLPARGIVFVSPSCTMSSRMTGGLHHLELCK